MTNDVDLQDARRRLVLDVARTDELIERLVAEHARIMDASQESNADDEHDPEGATIAFERQQLAALLEQARTGRSELGHALERIDAGDYGRCESCGEPIGNERLAARPAARTCITCAR